MTYTREQMVAYLESVVVSAANKAEFVALSVDQVKCIIALLLTRK